MEGQHKSPAAVLPGGAGQLVGHREVAEGTGEGEESGQGPHVLTINMASSNSKIFPPPQLLYLPLPQ